HDSNFVMPELFVSLWTPHVLSPCRVEYTPILTPKDKLSNKVDGTICCYQSQTMGLAPFVF
ncbi:MAG: hypothetical protein ACK5YR_00350, partial [Pirellula sp.]